MLYHAIDFPPKIPVEATAFPDSSSTRGISLSPGCPLYVQSLFADILSISSWQQSMELNATLFTQLPVTHSDLNIEMWESPLRGNEWERGFARIRIVILSYYHWVNTEKSVMPWVTRTAMRRCSSTWFPQKTVSGMYHRLVISKALCSTI